MLLQYATLVMPGVAQEYVRLLIIASSTKSATEIEITAMQLNRSNEQNLSDLVQLKFYVNAVTEMIFQSSS